MTDMTEVFNQDITLGSFYFQPECYYKGFRDEEGQLTPVHWYFISVFTYIVFVYQVHPDTEICLCHNL